MAMIAIGLARMVEDFGMDAVLVQDRSIIGDRQAQLAGLIILAGGVLCALFIALAHPVGWFFNEPMVVPVIMALSLLCVADAIQVVSRAGLQREMKFAQLAWAPLQILCIYAAYYTTLVLFGALLMWTGQFRANMWCSILAGVALPIAFILGTRWGLEGVAWAWAICFPLVNIPAMVIAFRTVEGSLVARVNAVWPALAASTAMAVAVVALRAALPSDLVPPVVAAASVAFGGVVYLVTLRILFRSRLREMWTFVKVLRGRQAKDQL